MATGGKRDPSSHRTPGQIKSHYAEYQGKPEQIAKRADRNAARAMMKKKLGAAAIAGKDIDHKMPIRSGGGNGAGNLRVRSKNANRGWEREPGR